MSSEYIIDDEYGAFEEPKLKYQLILPQKLVDIKDYLISKRMLLSHDFDDGRINASVNEDELINEILKKFDIIKPRARAWFDFAIEENKILYPVNIKITDTTHADNLNCKLGIYYSLTGLIPSFPNEINWLKYFEKLKEDLGTDETKDYYFLVFNKQNSQDIFINALKGLQILQPNGNNLPFQCKWDNNRNYKSRTFRESKKFLLTIFGQSIKQRAEIYFNYKKYFPEYV